MMDSVVVQVKLLKITIFFYIFLKNTIHIHLPQVYFTRLNSYVIDDLGVTLKVNLKFF